MINIEKKKKSCNCNAFFSRHTFVRISNFLELVKDLVCVRAGKYMAKLEGMMSMDETSPSLRLLGENPSPEVMHVAIGIHLQLLLTISAAYHMRVVSPLEWFPYQLAWLSHGDPGASCAQRMEVGRCSCSLVSHQSCSNSFAIAIVLNDT